MFTLWLLKEGSKRFSGLVIAVEPMPTNLALLRQNLEHHNLVHHKQVCFVQRNTCAPPGLMVAAVWSNWWRYAHVVLDFEK